MINPSVIKPKGLMILALVALAGISYVTYRWATEPILTPADVTLISGTVKEAHETTGKNRRLEITMAEQPHPFRCFSSTYPGSFKFDLDGCLGRGDAVTLGVPNSEVASPRHNLSRSETFLEIVSMSVGGEEALALDAHNKQTEMNRRVAPWFFGVVAMICIPIFLLGFRYRSSSEPIIEILKARKRAKQAA